MLPIGHPEKILNMKCWLIYYNKLDVNPLCHAIKNSFELFQNCFGMDPMPEISLPSLAYQAMFKSYDPTASLCFTFNKDFDEIRKLIRSQIFGGITNVYHRHAVCYDKDHVPFNARHAPNGDKFTSILMLDFNEYDFITYYYYYYHYN